MKYIKLLLMIVKMDFALIHYITHINVCLMIKTDVRIEEFQINLIRLLIKSRMATFDLT